MSQNAHLKVVYGCCALGFKDMTPPLTREEALSYMREHQHLILDPSVDDHYNNGLDLMYLDGHLSSWVL